MLPETTALAPEALERIIGHSWCSRRHRHWHRRLWSGSVQHRCRCGVEPLFVYYLLVRFKEGSEACHSPETIMLNLQEGGTHFTWIKSMPAWIGTNFYCYTCMKGYWKREDHFCTRDCSFCGMSKRVHVKTNHADQYITCSEYKCSFLTLECFMQHKKGREMNGLVYTTCERRYKCHECHAVVDKLTKVTTKKETTWMMKDTHQCYKYDCSFCGEKNVTRGEHQCYVSGVGEVELREWLNEQHTNGKQMNLQQELRDYCIQDVMVLLRGCLTFRNLYVTLFGVDPFMECVTLASTCLNVFKKNFLPPKTIGVVPPQGYRHRDICSAEALEWLYTLNIPDLKWAINGEATILGAKVDGYHEATKTIYQYYGCFWHGCETCFKNAGISILSLDVLLRNCLPRPPNERSSYVKQATRSSKCGVTRRTRYDANTECFLIGFVATCPFIQEMP